MTVGYRNIVVTGASGGIGGALAEELAQPGRALLLLGRDAGRLDAVAERVRGKGGEAVTACLVLGDRAAVEEAIATFDAGHPIDLVVTCAGVKCGNADGLEPEHQIRRIVDVNLVGTMETVQACLRLMLPRGRGRVGLISSLTALSPQPDLLSYSATKAAIRGYGIALRRSLRRSGIGVTVILPGFVDTEMTRRHDGPTPLTVSRERAARSIVRGLERGRNTVAFPTVLAILSWMEGFAPGFLTDRVHDGLRAKIVPDQDEAEAVDRTRK